MTDSLELQPHGGSPSPIRCEVSDGFPLWLSQAKGTIVLTTYQAGKVAMIGWDGQQVTLLFRDFEKPMGLDTLDSRMLLATRHQVIELANAPLLAHEYLEGQPGRYDALYLPRVSYYTGDLNVHDVAYGAECLWLVNTRFSCLASPSHEYCFVPRSRPPFISLTVPEDRCHLNGLAMEDGRPRFVTALGESDAVGGWRQSKATGGIVIDVPSGAIVVRGLSMPHSPRLYNGRSGCSTRARPNSGESNLARSAMKLSASCPAICAGSVSSVNTLWLGSAPFARNTSLAICPFSRSPLSCVVAWPLSTPSPDARSGFSNSQKVAPSFTTCSSCPMSFVR